MGKNAQRRRAAKAQPKVEGRSMRSSVYYEQARERGMEIPNRAARRGNPTHGKRTST